LRYFAHEGVNLHSRDIRKQEGDFVILRDAAVRERFLGELSALLDSLPFTLFATAIRKLEHRARYRDGARNPYDVALEFTFERVLHFMESRGTTQLPVIAEARGQREDDALRASFYRLLSEGTPYNRAERFQRLVCPLSFRNKLTNVCGIQVADLCAYPTARHVLNTAKSDRAWDVVAKHFYRSGRVDGLKIFP